MFDKDLTTILSGEASVTGFYSDDEGLDSMEESDSPNTPIDGTTRESFNASHSRPAGAESAAGASNAPASDEERQKLAKDRLQEAMAALQSDHEGGKRKKHKRKKKTKPRVQQA
mmetsp:Transcript_25607/g.64326  ORF Transcript_25607/g.64326 Transcript_25607/m.64326 type:complete len:114 (-) Transcript_25607:2941-3282(-)